MGFRTIVVGVPCVTMVVIAGVLCVVVSVVKVPVLVSTGFVGKCFMLEVAERP